jgi:hypothetical protein
MACEGAKWTGSDSDRRRQSVKRKSRGTNDLSRDKIHFLLSYEEGLCQEVWLGLAKLHCQHYSEYEK